MKGKVLGYKDGVPVIVSDDSKRFLARSGPNLPVGSTVDFIESGDEAIDVFPIGSVPGEKKRGVAALLAFVLGWIGADFFYLRKWSTAWTIAGGYLALNFIARQVNPHGALLILIQVGFLGAGWIRAVLYLSKNQSEFAKEHGVTMEGGANA